MKVDNPEEAIDEFLGVPALEEEKSDWYRPFASLILRNMVVYADIACQGI